MKNYTFKKLLINIGLTWWTGWSNFRFRKALKDNVLLDEDKVKNCAEIRRLLLRLYDKFNYTDDGVDQLFDAVTPPPQNYQYYLDGEVKDDCDGFHSLLYHCLAKSGIECYLLTVHPTKITSSHCVLLLKLNGLYRVIDYRTIYTGSSTAEEAIATYNEVYPKKYGTPEVIYNSTIKYDYDKGKLVRVYLKKEEKSE